MVLLSFTFWEGSPVEEVDTIFHIFEITVITIIWNILFHFKKCLEIGTNLFFQIWNEGLALSWSDWVGCFCQKKIKLWQNSYLKSPNFFILQSLDYSVASTMYKNAEIRIKIKEFKPICQTWIYWTTLCVSLFLHATLAS